MLPSGSIASSLSIPLTSRCAERAFSDWDRHYRLNVFTSSAFVERSLFISQFSYPTILSALQSTKPTVANVTFVYKLECRPKRKGIETDCWEKQQLLSIGENKKYFLNIACDSLKKKFPSLCSIKKIPSKQFFFEALSCMAPGVTFSDRLKNNTKLDIIKTTTLLYAHSIKKVTLMPYYLKVLCEEKCFPKPNSPLFCLIDQQPNAIERFNQHPVLMLTQEGCGEGDTVPGGKRKRNKWEGAVIVEWSGEREEYLVLWENDFNNNQSFPRKSFLGGAEDILIEFWEGEEIEIADKELRLEIEKQREGGKECEEKIARIERNGGNIINCVTVVRRGKQSRRRVRDVCCIFYHLKNSKEEIWVEKQEVKKKSLLLDYWEGLNDVEEEENQKKKRGGSDVRGGKKRRI